MNEHRSRMACAAALIAAAAAGRADWPTVQHDMRRTGYTSTCPAPPYRYRWVWAGGDRLDEEKFEAWRKRTRDRTNQLPLELFPDFSPARFMNFAQPMAVGGVAYIGSVEGELFAIDVKTGRTRWRRRASGAILHSVTVAGGAVFAGTLRGVDAFGTEGRGAGASSILTAGRSGPARPSRAGGC